MKTSDFNILYDFIDLSCDGYSLKLNDHLVPEAQEDTYS